MQNSFDQIYYQNYAMALRAEYEEEKRVFSWMKRLGFIFGIVFAIAVFFILLINSPTLLDQTGPEGLIVLIPVILFGTGFIGFWMGMLPAGYIGLWRAIRRSGLFICGNFIGLAIVATFLVSIPVLLGPIFFVRQCAKVSNLKKKIDVCYQ